MAATDTGERTTKNGCDEQGDTASRPTNCPPGFCYFDFELSGGDGQPIWWNGTEWVDATGTAV